MLTYTKPQGWLETPSPRDLKELFFKPVICDCRWWTVSSVGPIFVFGQEAQGWGRVLEGREGRSGAFVAGPGEWAGRTASLSASTLRSPNGHYIAKLGKQVRQHWRKTDNGNWSCLLPRWAMATICPPVLGVYERPLPDSTLHTNMVAFKGWSELNRHWASGYIGLSVGRTSQQQ